MQYKCCTAIVYISSCPSQSSSSETDLVKSKHFKQINNPDIFCYFIFIFLNLLFFLLSCHTLAHTMSTPNMPEILFLVGKNCVQSYIQKLAK